MKTKPNWNVVVKCNKMERNARFLAFSLKLGGTAKTRLATATQMTWLFSNKRDAEKFARRARKATNGFERVEVVRNV